MGKHERAALEREKLILSSRATLSQMEGRRLDEIERLLASEPCLCGGNDDLSGHLKGCPARSQN